MNAVIEPATIASGGGSAGGDGQSDGEIVRRRPVVVPSDVKGPLVLAEYLLAVPDVSLLVDGYNFVFRLWPESKQDIGDARRRLERQMHELAAQEAIDVVVVWDGIQEPDAVPRLRRSHRAHAGGASVVFSRGGLTADDTIVLWCENLPPDQPIVVATEDRELAQRVGRVGANVIRPISLAANLPAPPSGDSHLARQLAGQRTSLERLLASADPAASLWEAIRDGTMADIVPEVLDLRDTRDSACQHGHMLAHTIAVVECAPLEFTVRLAALVQDIGMPVARESRHGNETFYHHERIGARMVEERLGGLQFDWRTVHDVSDLVRMSGRLDGCAEWSNSGVRRYVSEIGPLRRDLHDLVRADRAARGDETAHSLREIGDLERRIDEIAASDAHAAERPQIDGNEVMTHLDLKPGPQVGKALRWLSDLRRLEGDLPSEELLERLDGWWRSENQF